MGNYQNFQCLSFESLRNKKSRNHQSGTSLKANRVGLRRPCKHASQYIRLKLPSDTQSSEKTELSKSQHQAHTKKHKLIRVVLPLMAANTATRSGGFFMPVTLTNGGFLSGTCRLQDRQRRKQAHHSIRWEQYPAICQMFTTYGATPMMLTAINGAPRPHPGQMRLPTISIPAENEFQFPESDLDYIDTETGVLVTFTGLMVAWIYRGHAGSRNNPGACTFFDVAFPSLTFGQQNRVTGMMLDSSSFDSLADAVQFVEATFSNGGEA